MNAYLKSMIKATASRLGVEGPATTAWDSLKARGFTPWKPLVPADAFTRAIDNAVQALLEVEPSESFGKYVEFGVSRGTSMACMHHVLKKHKALSRLVGFDSFEGMPADTTGSHWHPGQYHSTLAATRHYLASNGVDLSRVELIKGWFDETLTDELQARLALTKTSIFMVDCDIYSASKQALSFCAPLIGKHALLIFDDWGWTEETNELGQKEAFRELMSANATLSARELPGYIPQSRIFLLSRVT